MRSKFADERPGVLDSSILECAELWLEENDFKDETKRKHRAALRRFAEHVGNARIREVTRRHVADFVVRLETLPDSQTLSPAKRSRTSMAELSALRQQWLWQKSASTPAEAWPLISSSTVNRHLEAVKAMFSWVASQNPDFLNPTRDVKRSLRS